MPGRLFTALTVPGGSVTGTTQVNGFTVPVDLALSTRTGNEPTQYVATRTIDLDEGFESGTDDDVTAYLTDTSYAGTGNGGSGADGVAGNGKYPYTYNGKREDNDAETSWQDYGMREYDRRRGQFISVDPLTAKYPWYSPYQYAGNKPVWKRDRDGLEEEDEESKLEEREELEEEREKEERQAKIRNALKNPTAEEQAKRQKEFEEFSRKPPEERGKINEGILGRIKALSGLKDYINKGFEAARITLSPSESQWVNGFVAHMPARNYGITKFDDPLSTDALRVLSEKLGGVEVAQIFVKQGQGGYYSILYGTNSRIIIPKYEEGTPYLLSHVHPSGNEIPSNADIEILQSLQTIQASKGQPVQSSSTIIPLGKPNAQFNINTPTLSKSGTAAPNVNLKPLN